MLNKFLISALCGSTLLLTACGGGSGDSNKDSVQGKEKVDYTKPETIESIYEPVISLSRHQNNFIVIGGELAENIFYHIQAGYGFKCSSGSYTKNKDNSITFNQCKNPTPINKDGNPIDLGLTSISGTINSQETLFTNSGRYNTTLKSFKITPENDFTLAYDGNMINEYSYSSTKYQIKQMTVTAFDTATQETEHLIINNYLLDLASLTANAQGNIESSLDNKVFSVNFKSELRFANDDDDEAFYPSFAEISIEDTANKKNSISITKTSNYRALIRAYADSKPVSGYPKTVDWADFQ